MVVPLERKPILTVDNMHHTIAEQTSWVDDVGLWGVGGKRSVDRLVEMSQDVGLARATMGTELGHRLRLGVS
jgi:hypothetical protein